MTRLSLGGLALAFAFTAFPFASCTCTKPPGPPHHGGEGEGEGAGAGEGEGEGGGPTTPPKHPIRTPDPNNPNNANLDSDCDGLSDAEEFSTVYAAGKDANGNTITHTDPANYDSDGDGVADGIEAGRTAVIDPACAAAGGTWLDADPTTTTSPVSADTDGDCLLDGVEDKNQNGRVDPGETDPNSADSDHDGLCDGNVSVNGCVVGEDKNCNGVVDTGETDPSKRDTDGDGLDDSVEPTLGTDPTNPDTDGDGFCDGPSSVAGVCTGGDPNPTVAAPDADHDGLPDAVEAAEGTDPNNPDTDGDGLCDGPKSVAGVCVGGEDLNANGRIDPGETDPKEPDTDCDGVSDGEERQRGTNPRVKDTDGDLLTDGVELGKTGPVAGSSCTNVAVDADPTTTTDPLNPDTDGDGINDGTEDRNHDGKLAPPNPGGVQETDPSDPDTDGDGICDGPKSVAGVCTAGEDLNRNGLVDQGETDPRVSDQDSDGDGLTDSQEAQLGTDPHKADTDGDGLSDGDEVNQLHTNPLSVDTDCDGITDGAEVALGTDPLKRDTDGDGLLDGVEHGTRCTVGTETDAACTAANAPIKCVPDADPATTTDPKNADTDNGGVQDGAEDSNQNGKIDPGELNPNDPSDDQATTVQNACATNNLRQVTLVTRPDQTADLILAVPTDFPNNRITTLTNSSGQVVGAMVFDPNDQVAGVALKVQLAGANANAQTATLQSKLATVGVVDSINTQAFASWDTPGGNNAALSHITWHDTQGGNTTPTSLNRIVQALVPGATGTLDTSAGTDAGEMQMETEVLDRSAASTIVVISLASQTRAASTERVGFKLDDMANGTAIAQFGDTTGVQCDRFTVLPVPKVDYIMIIDNSGSMNDEQNAVVAAGSQIGAQLSNATVDFRIAVLTSDTDQLINDAPTWTSCEFGQGGTCSGAGGGQKVYCPFTNDVNQTSSCVDQININGSGEELFFKPFACVMGSVVNGPGIDQNINTNAGELGGSQDGEQCGRNANLGNRAPFSSATTYPAPPSPFQMLPRAANDPTKIRTGAKVAVIFITDANEQTDGRYAKSDPAYPGDAIAIHSVPTWVSFFSNFDGAGDPVLSKAFVAGIVCPNGAGCSDENGNYENPRFTTFLQSMGGLEAALPNNSDPQQAAKIQAAIAAILQASIGQASPYVLQKPPISATIKISMTAGSTVGACNVADVPRSRVNGFDYDGTTNSITFFGDCRPKIDNSAVGQPFAVSYRFWIQDSPNPDGNNNTCQCASPFVCNASNQCVCPADCGVAGGLGAGQTCNAQCQVECLPDCGGCANGAVCDASSPTCACSCPLDCNTGTGQPLPAGQTCDPATCLPICDQNGCQGAPPGPNFVCGPDCTYQCPADCGGATLTPTQVCDPTTCAPTCSPDCNAQCGGFSTCDQGSCSCQCVASATCAPGFTFNPDPSVCDCTCDATALACPATHTANLTDCRCDCGTNCNGACSAAEICSQSTCSCSPIGG